MNLTNIWVSFVILVDQKLIKHFVLFKIPLQKINQTCTSNAVIYNIYVSIDVHGLYIKTNTYDRNHKHENSSFVQYV